MLPASSLRQKVEAAPRSSAHSPVFRVTNPLTISRNISSLSVARHLSAIANSPLQIAGERASAFYARPVFHAAQSARCARLEMCEQIGRKSVTDWGRDKRRDRPICATPRASQECHLNRHRSRPEGDTLRRPRTLSHKKELQSVRQHP